jgi:hypothetical protein
VQAQDVALAVGKPGLLGAHDSHEVGGLDVGQVFVTETQAAVPKVLDLVRDVLDLKLSRA